MNRQERIRRVGITTFGAPSMNDQRERVMRFAEEAMECCRAAGMTQGELIDMVRYEFARPEGRLSQELAGAAVTLYALADVHAFNLEVLCDEETTRVYTERDKIRAKAQKKPTHVVSTRCLPPQEEAA